MQRMTSAYANKMIKSLEEDKAFWLNKEESSLSYVVALGEEPVIPDYDYTEVAKVIEEIDERISVIKHALNFANVNSKLDVGDAQMSVDTILVKMAQLNNRKRVLDSMRKQLPKARVASYYGAGRKSNIEYRYINYDLELIKEEYERISMHILNMQMALDIYNQTVQFEVDI